MYPINNRLAALPELLGYESPAALAKACGIDPNTFRKAMQGPSKPGYDVLSALITKQQRINPEWLLTGKGPILREPGEVPVAQLPPPVPSHAEEPQAPRYTGPVMRAVPDLSHLTAEQQADYWYRRWEKAQARLAEYASTLEHEETIRLLAEPGGKPLASADAADADEERPYMKAESNPEFEEAATWRPNKVGFKFGVAALV